jgi:hypothetical protein
MRPDYEGPRSESFWYPEMSDQPVQESLQKIETSFFQTPTFQALTIGVPFCIFKILFGLLGIRIGIDQQFHLILFGWLIILWASLDLIMNLIVAAFNMTGHKSPIEFCTIAQLGRLFGKQNLFLAIDTLIAFIIICFVLWTGWIKLLNINESYLWYAATTLNLISISVVNIWLELRR